MTLASCLAHGHYLMRAFDRQAEKNDETGEVKCPTQLGEEIPLVTFEDIAIEERAIRRREFGPNAHACLSSLKRWWMSICSLGR